MLGVKVYVQGKEALSVLSSVSSRVAEKGFLASRSTSLAA